MLVAEILKDKGDGVFTINPDRTLAQACAALNQHRVGALIVQNHTDEGSGEREGPVLGILSERDVVRAIAKHGVEALVQPISFHMTSDVVFAAPVEAVAVLMARMTDRRIRHLPVLRDGHLAGVISIGDVVKCQIAEATREAESLRTYIAAG